MMIDTEAPAIVYLDSQDFSRFSPSHGDYEKFRAVMDELLSLKEHGLARFVFSDIHVFESLPTERAAFKPGLERIRAIAMLCGTNNLPSFIDSMEFELRCMVATSQGGPSPVAPRDWFPELPFPEPSRPGIKAAAKELPNLQLNRRARRQLERAFSKGGLGPTPKAQAEASARELMATYPFLKADHPRIVAYFQGVGSWSGVHEAVRNGLRDIVSFSDWLLDNWDRGESLVGALRNQVRPFHDTMLKVQTDMVTVSEQTLGTHPTDEARHQISAAIAREWATFQTTFPARLATKMLGTLPASHDLRFSEAETPSLMTTWHFLFEVVSRSTAAKNARKPRPSDFADALHAFFAPQVDIFRTDRFACDVIGRLPSARRAVCVNSLHDLPDAIRDFHIQRE